MRLGVLVKIVKKALRYGVFGPSLSIRFGGGWRGILIAASVRASFCCVCGTALSYFVAREAFSVERSIFVTVVFFIYCILFEKDTSRRSRWKSAE
jgi:ABC-type Mn2+/Zn2+ transport system permease subunit